MAVLPELAEGTTATSWWREQGELRWRQLERDSRGEVTEAHASAWRERARLGGAGWSDELVRFSGLRTPEPYAVIEPGQELPVQIVQDEPRTSGTRPEWLEVFSDGSVLARRQDSELAVEHGSLLQAMQAHELTQEHLTDQVRFLTLEEIQMIREAENWPGHDRAYALAPDTREPFMHDFSRRPGDPLADVLALGSDAYNASATFARAAIRQGAEGLGAHDLKALVNELRSRHEQVDKALSGTESHLESRLQTARLSEAVSQIENIRASSPEGLYQDIEEFRHFGPALQSALELRIEALTRDSETRQETLQSLSGRYGVGNPTVELACTISRLKDAHHQLFVEGPDPDFRPLSHNELIEAATGMSAAEYYGVDDDDHGEFHVDPEDDAQHETYPNTPREIAEDWGSNASRQCERWAEQVIKAVESEPDKLEAIAADFRAYRTDVLEALADAEQTIENRRRELDSSRSAEPAASPIEQPATLATEAASAAPERDNMLVETAHDLKAWVDRKIEQLTRSRDAGPDR
jgi:hypothetical protein